VRRAWLNTAAKLPRNGAVWICSSPSGRGTSRSGGRRPLASPLGLWRWLARLAVMDDGWGTTANVLYRCLEPLNGIDGEAMEAGFRKGGEGGFVGW